jgi:hypothetical protein
VIVVADQMISLEDIAGGIHVETNDGQIELVEPGVLEPCVEFTRFILSPESQAITDAALNVPSGSPRSRSVLFAAH